VPTERQQAKTQAAQQQAAETYRAEVEKWRSSAQAYRSAGHDFFVLKLNLGGVQSGFFETGGEYGGVDPTGILQAVERAGWHLEDSGYVYMTTRNQSHLLTDSTSVQGYIVGIYTFRRRD
jgi:hypothetical protein